MLNGRTASILTAVVKEFIASGEPVSSEQLYERYDFGIKPAMIRLELSVLSGLGFLEQPHHAAGRVPTNKGYEFYAQNLVSQDLSANCTRTLIDLFERRAWLEFLREFSSELDVLGAALVFPQKAVYKSMLANLIDHWDWPAVELRSLVHDFENLEERLAAMESVPIEDKIRVFIGRKSPITRGENLAVMAANYNIDGNGNRVFVCAIGPKRMDYRKTARVMRGLKIAEIKTQRSKVKTAKL